MQCVRRLCLLIPLLGGWQCAFSADDELLEKARFAYESQFGDAALRAELASNSRSDVSFFARIGVVAQHVRRGEYPEAFEQVRSLGVLPNRLSPATFDLVQRILVATEENSGRPVDVVTRLAPSLGRIHDGWDPDLTPSYFRSLVGAGLLQEAVAQLRNSKALRKHVLQNERTFYAMVALAQALKAADQMDDLQFIHDLQVSEIPFIAPAFDSFALQESLMCQRLKPTFDLAEERRELKRVQRILYDVPHEDTRQFGMALAGISETDLLSSAEKSLTLEGAQRYVDAAAFLLQVREFKLSLKALEKARDYKNPWPSELRQRWLALRGRASNALGLPKEAESFYRELVKSSSGANVSARERLLLSLHYQGKYAQEADLARKYAGKKIRQPSVAWDVFWPEYLAGRYASATKLAKTILSGSGNIQTLKTKTRYWQARIYEKTRRIDAARQLYREIADGDRLDVHHLLAKWRLERLASSSKFVSESRLPSAHPDQIPKQDELFKANAASWLNGNQVGMVQRGAFGLEPTAELIAALGLQEYSHDLLGRSPNPNSNPAAAAQYAERAFLLQKFKVASTVSMQTLDNDGSPFRSYASFAKSVARWPQLWRLAYPFAYAPVVKSVAETLGISPFLILSIMRAESNYAPDVMSGVGARGLMQIMPRSGGLIASFLQDPAFIPERLAEPFVAIGYGGWYLKRLLDYYQGNYVLAIAAYNAGPEAVDRWIAQAPGLEIDEFIDNIPYDQTRFYVGKVSSHIAIYSSIYGESQGEFKFRLPTVLPKPKTGMLMF